MTAGGRFAPVAIATLLPRAIAVLLAATALAACGGGDDGAMRLVLTDDGCTYEGAEALGDGSFTVEVENRSSLDGAFSLAAIAAGSTVEDLETHLEVERRRHEQGQELLGPPPFYEQVVRTAVGPGLIGQLPVDVPAGSYALVCLNDDPRDWRAYIATPLEVEG